MIGNLSGDVLEAMMETLPVEFSVVDENDNVLAWNKHDTRIFKRPEVVVGRNVRDCHPQKSVDNVLTILTEMKEGKREKARFWIDLGEGDAGRKVMIEYYALRSPAGKYLGCLEASQDITDIRKIEGQKRILEQE
ncbi:MAG: PAS domain-containing protein [Methanobacteriota archaeon]|nr:MAG: PAS domain-containing protein [Euryarchaeota archaeon]